MAGAKGKTKKKPPAKAAPSKPKAAQRAKPAPVRAAPPRPRTEPATAAPTVGKPLFTSAQPAVRPRPLITGDFTLDKLHQIALTATNLDVAIEFYRDILGLKFIARYDPPGLAFFALGGGTRLMLSATSSQATLYFSVDNVDDAVHELKKRGVSFMHPPAMVHRDDAGAFGKKGNQEWMTFFKDPSGNVIGLVERR